METQQQGPNTIDLTPHVPNESGETNATVRWMVETPGGWIGGYDKSALEWYKRLIQEEEQRRCKHLALDIIGWYAGVTSKITIRFIVEDIKRIFGADPEYIIKA